MRIVEFTRGIAMPISNEEAGVLDHITEQAEPVPKSALSERDQVLANQLVNKGLIIRRNYEGVIKYSRQKTS